MVMKSLIPLNCCLSVFFRCSVIFLSVITYPIILCAQHTNISFERFSTEDGMPSTYVVDITQDQEGFIWLGTFDGLVKYDGYQFLTFRNIPGDSTSLNDNSIEAIYVDFTGDLWVGTKSGLNRFESSCDCFFRYFPDPSNPNSLTPGQINTFAEDQSKTLWIGTQQGGLFRYERESDRFTRFLYDPKDLNNLIEDQVRVLLADQNGYLWIGTGEPFDPAVTGGGLIRFNLATGTTKRFRSEPNNPNSLIDDRVSALLEDQNGVLWVGTCKSGLHYYNPEKEEFIQMMPNPDDPNHLYAPQGSMGLWSSCPHVRILHQDKRGAFWVGTFNGGINYFDPITGILSHYEHNPDNPNSLANNMVFTLFEDRQERLWIGNLLAGFHKIEPSLHKFIVYVNDPDDPTSLSYNNVMGIYEAPNEPGVIWLGTRGGGLNRLNLMTSRFTSFRHISEDDNSIGSDIVWTTFEDQSGAFWVGTEEGLDKFDRQTGKFHHYKLNTNDTESSFTNAVIQLYEDKQNYLWIGTWSGGLFRFNLNSDTYKQYDFSGGNQGTYYNSIFLIHEDAEETLWVGTWLGALYRYDRQKDTFIPKLEGFGAICLHEDSSGGFWIGTQNDGLLHFDPSSSSLKNYNVADGLPSNSVCGILEDNQGFYWLSTGKGISKFDPNLITFSNYDISDGLPDNSFNYLSALKSSNEQLFFGGNEGLVSFFPDQVKSNPFPPEVILTGLQISDEPFNLRNPSFEKSGKVFLSYNQNDLTFDYVALHYTDPQKNKYRYRLEPYEPDWIDAGNQRTARYTNLDPGEYTFQVKASNSDGVWNEEGASIKIILLPPWWSTWWAYSLYVLFGLGFLYSIRRYEQKRIQLKNQIKLDGVKLKERGEIDRLKSRFFANISHEFRTPLTLIFGPANDVLEKTKEPDTKQSVGSIKRNAGRLYGLVNQLLDLSKLEAGRMTLETREQDIIPLLRGLTLSFTSLAERKKITLTFNTIEDNLNVYIDNDKVEKIITNLLSNAFKFTPEGGKIDFTVEKLKKDVEIRISDNGRGIPEERINKIFDRFYQVDGSQTRESEGTGIGLALTKELVELHKGKISVESKEGEGSTFTILLPLGKEHLKPNEIIQKEIREKTKKTIEEKELVPETDKSKGKADIDVLLETGKPILLIVEDNLDVRNYIVSHLEKDYRIVEAINGEDGFTRSIEQIPDLIVSDVMMPKMDGFQFCAKIKTDERTSHIPVILLTAKASGESKIEGLETGADDYIMKPFDAKELKVRIRNLIEQRKKLREHFLKEGFFNLDNKDITSVDKKFLEKTVKIINEHLSDSSFGVELFANKIALGRATLHKKLVALVGEPPSELIKRMRLGKAAKLIEKNLGNISEIALEVGFNNPAYFSECFRKQFGVTPSQYQHNFTNQ